MTAPPRSLQQLVGRAKALGPIKVAIADAAQDLIIETLRDAQSLGLIEPQLIGQPDAIRRAAIAAGWPIPEQWIVPAQDDGDAACQAAALVRGGEADAVMKGRLHTDTLMHALLDKGRGLRAPGRRVSHVFVVEVPSHPKLLVGIANEHSLAWAAAQRFRSAGADLAINYIDEATRPYVEPLAREAACDIFLPCDVRALGELDEVFDAIRTKWGGLDLLFHAIGWAPRQYLRGRLTDCSAEGFAEAMLVSCRSFIRMAKLAEPLMARGGSLMTLSYYGAEKVVDHYNVMGR